MNESFDCYRIFKFAGNHAALKAMKIRNQQLMPGAISSIKVNQQDRKLLEAKQVPWNHEQVHLKLQVLRRSLTKENQRKLKPQAHFKFRAQLPSLMKVTQQKSNQIRKQVSQTPEDQ